MMNLITEVSVAFQTERRVDICEARYLIVKCIERLKNALNSNGRIREHLSPYPFSNRGMDISIIFIKNDGTLVDYGNVCEGDGGVSAVYQLNDKLYYPSYNACTKQLERYYIESYEEAVFWMGNAPLRMNFKRALTFDEVSIHTEE